MSSTYAPVPFSYLAAGSQAPKTGFRKDEGLYGSRRDMAKPIPALRHDLPRNTADSIDHRLRCADPSPVPEPRRSRDPSDTESSLSHSNLRLPRSDISLYQSQIVGPVSGNRSTAPLVADTPSGHYSNQSPSPSTPDMVDAVGHPSTNDQSASAPKSQGMFDNFILLGPGVQSSQADGGARRTDDEQPTSSRLEQLFDNQPPSSDVAPTGRQQADVTESRTAPQTVENSSNDDSLELPRSDQMMTNSLTVTTSGPSRFGIGDRKLMQRLSSTDLTAGQSYCCCGHSTVYCTRCRLCVLVAVAVFIALLMLGVGFVVGWYASQLQQSPGSPPAAASTWPGQTESSTPMQTETSGTAARNTSTLITRSSSTITASTSTVKQTTPATKTTSTAAITSVSSTTVKTAAHSTL